MAELFLHSFRPAAWVEVSGEDAFGFLQGQFSNDLRPAGARNAVYGLWLDAKGKVRGDSRILCARDRYFLFSCHTPSASLVEGLEHYLFADDVEIADATASVGGAAVWGEGAGAFLESLGYPRVPDGGYAADGEIRIVSGRRSRDESFELLFPADQGEAVLARLEAALRDGGGVLADSESCHYERIRSGIPAVPVDLDSRSLPHEGGLETEAISYEKGCYTGQEVMARLRHAGRVRRRLAAVSLRGEPPALPRPVYHGETEAGRMTSSGCRAGERLGFVLGLRSHLVAGKALSFAPGGEESIQILDS